MTNQNNAAQPMLTDDEIMRAAINASGSLNITRVHEIGGPSRTIMEDAGLLELGRAIETAVLSKLRAPVAGVAQPVAYRVLRKTHDGDWKNDGRCWCDGAPSTDLKNDIAQRADRWCIEYAYAAPQASGQAAPSDEHVSVVGMPEFDALLDHIYEHGTTSEGVRSRADALARALLSRYAAPQASAEAIRNAALEEAASLIESTNETTTVENGGETQRHLTARKGAGNMNGLAWAAGIRALKSAPAAEAPAKGADVALPPLPEARIESRQTDSTMRTTVLHTYDESDMRYYARAAVLADRQQRGGDHFRDATKMVSTEDLHITHRPLIREAVALLRLRQPATPDFERVASELETALDGLPTPAGAPSQEWLEVAALAATKGESNG